MPPSKTVLFHILHVTQSRVSMWLTVSRRSVKKAEPLVVEKINLKIFPSYTALVCVILGYLKQRNGPTFNHQP